MDTLFFRPGDRTNFGDELNPWLWPQLVPELATAKTKGVVVGIGTLLNDLLPSDVDKFILGSGAGYGKGPAQPDASWKTYFVRGPRTASLLGLEPDRAVTDGAVLIPETHLQKRSAGKTGLMPHWQSELGSWRRAAEHAGLSFIDPTDDVETVLRGIAECDLLLTEAMHGAIVADLIRVPWIPIKSRPGILDFKWLDWCESLDLVYRPVVLPTLWPPSGSPSTWAQAKRWAKLRLISEQLRRLSKGAAEREMLSDDRTLLRKKHEAQTRLAQFRDDLALLQG